MMIATAATIDFERLFRLRLVVARHGEMDRARWWNTQGMLGPRGAMVLERGLPRTHYFAQARVVFAVARSRCQELFDPPRSITLWNLPAEIEDELEEHYQSWLDDRDTWVPIFESLASPGSDDLLTDLAAAELVSPFQVEIVHGFRRSAENRAVLIPGVRELNNHILTLLAATFSLGTPGSPAIPYVPLEA
jgi:hypothetical protein